MGNRKNTFLISQPRHMLWVLIKMFYNFTLTTTKTSCSHHVLALSKTVYLQLWHKQKYKWCQFLLINFTKGTILSISTVHFPPHISANKHSFIVNMIIKILMHLQMQVKVWLDNVINLQRYFLLETWWHYITSANGFYAAGSRWHTTFSLSFWRTNATSASEWV